MVGMVLCCCWSPCGAVGRFPNVGGAVFGIVTVAAAAVVSLPIVVVVLL